MTKFLSRFFGLLLILAAAWLLIFGKRPSQFRLPLQLPDGTILTNQGPPVRHRTILTFWEKWQGHEERAIQNLVDRYNLSQGRVFVNMVSMANINQKMLIATAGGDPPDLVGLWSAQVGPYMANNAIEPLDELVADGTVTSATYKPFVWRVCAPAHDRLYAVSSTPNTCCLYWNKDIFRSAGLDPEKPPTTMEELDALAEKLVLRDGNRIDRVGFLPNEPGWWDYYWGAYWGNTLYDPDTGRFHLDTPQQVAAYTWYQSYFRRYGPGETSTFRAGFGEFAGPRNAFLSGKVAMVVQGPFFAMFIALNNPAMASPDHYGVTFVPLPKSLGKPPNSIAIGDPDVWVIPRGARHKKESLDVLRFFTRRDNMERLCAAHAKPSPLMNVSPEFLALNPNPYIKVFEATMRAPTVFTMPQSPVWEQVQREINVSLENLWRMPDTTPVAPTLSALQHKADEIVTRYQQDAQRRKQ